MLLGPSPRAARRDGDRAAYPRGAAARLGKTDGNRRPPAGYAGAGGENREPMDDATTRMPPPEWLEADGLGGFASGTASGLRTRRYHALLAVARTPPTGRVVLVAAIEATLVGAGERQALSSHVYDPDVLHPDGLTRLAGFTHEPWPRWTFGLAGGASATFELFVPRGAPAVVLRWRVERASPGARLEVRPLLAARGLHQLEAERGDLDLAPRKSGGTWSFELSPNVPRLAVSCAGTFRAEPLWYRRFLLREERARGFDHLEDLASPGVFELDPARGPASIVFAATGDGLPELAGGGAEELAAAERERRARFASPLERAAEAYLVRRGAGKSLVAGYPWFTDWGRDTFIAMRGLYLGRPDVARGILVEWSRHVSAGLLPNRFVDEGSEPDLNSVDAALWFVVAAHETLAAAGAEGDWPRGARAALRAAIEAILEGYRRGTRYRIGVRADGLVAAGEGGSQLTWMDARSRGTAVTPRVGKPVEIQALWINALRAGEALDPRWRELRERAQSSFEERFWNAERGCLFDVVDADHVPGAADASLRPNQILAVGGLPHALLAGERARSVVDVVERELWTPLGLRTLAPGDPRYVGRYVGGPDARDAAYHQGTAWPWLIGPFVEAWVRVRGSGGGARRRARERFVQPLLEHLGAAGLGHVSEIADGDAPHAPRGAPFQAWSLGELLRLERQVLAGD